MSNSLTIQELIIACKKGDETAYLELVQRYQDRIFWIAYNLVRNREDSQDIVQESFIRIYKNLYRFQLEKNFETWLYRIVYNLSIDLLRKRKIQRKQSLDEVPDIPLNKPSHFHIEEKESTRQIYESLDKLPEKYRQILILKDLDGLSSKKISEILGYNHATIRWYLHIARKMFKKQWQRINPEEK
ncbi:MAG: sigma-70 family RNA polymerase sigma factor [Planctomycetota bacterium]